MNFKKEEKIITHKTIGIYLPIDSINKLKKLSKVNKISMNKLIDNWIKKETSL